MSDLIEQRIQKMATALSGPAWNRGAIVVYLREFAENLVSFQKQKQEKKECPICHRCGEPLDKAGVKEYKWDRDGGAYSCVHKFAELSKDPVEEKINQILFAEHDWLKDRLQHRLRELVALARKP